MNHNNSTAINNHTASSSSSSLSLGQHSFLSLQPQSFVSDTGVDDVGVTHENYRKKRSKRIIIGGVDDSAPTTLKLPRSGTKKKKPEASTNFTSKTTTRPTCSECGKQFMSWKALFGHMRCHPERQWRGMNPPQKLQRSNIRDGTGLIEEDEEIATCLLLLAKGGGSLPISCEMDDDSGMLHSGGPSVPPDTDGTGQLRSFDKVERSSYMQVFGSTSTARQGGPGGNGEHDRLMCHRQREKSDGGGGGGGGVLDLNLPAPVETLTTSCSSTIELALDLKLGV